MVWPQGQPLCHLRQGWTTPTHPGLSEPTEEVPLPLCHRRSQHRLGPTHPITRRAGKPEAPAAPAAPTSPGRGPARREGRGTPGTAGARPVRSVSRPRCARSCRALPGVLYRLRRKTTRGSSGGSARLCSVEQPRIQTVKLCQALRRGSPGDPTPVPGVFGDTGDTTRSVKRRVPPRARVMPTPLASRPWNAPVRRPRAASPVPAATPSRLMTGCDCGG